MDSLSLSLLVFVNERARAQRDIVYYEFMTDGQMDGPTDGQTRPLIYRCDDSKLHFNGRGMMMKVYIHETGCAKLSGLAQETYFLQYFFSQPPPSMKT